MWCVGVFNVHSCSWYLTGRLLLSYQRVGTLPQLCVRDDTRAQHKCADTDTYMRTCTQAYTYTDIHTNSLCHAPHMRARTGAHSHLVAQPSPGSIGRRLLWAVCMFCWGGVEGMHGNGVQWVTVQSQTARPEPAQPAVHSRAAPKAAFASCVC